MTGSVDAAPDPLPEAASTPGSQAGIGIDAAAGSAIPQAELNRITDDLITQFKTVFDPEIPVDVYELGLIYKVDINDDRHVDVEMTLTAPGCPVAGEMPGWVEAAALKVDGVKTAKVNIVFDPPWTPARMSDEAKLELNML
jgi:FeS assembly SUF system protein